MGYEDGKVYAGSSVLMLDTNEEYVVVKESLYPRPFLRQSYSSSICNSYVNIQCDCQIEQERDRLLQKNNEQSNQIEQLEQEVRQLKNPQKELLDKTNKEFYNKLKQELNNKKMYGY